MLQHLKLHLSLGIRNPRVVEKLATMFANHSNLKALSIWLQVPLSKIYHDRLEQILLNQLPNSLQELDFRFTYDGAIDFPMLAFFFGNGVNPQLASPLPCFTLSQTKPWILKPCNDLVVIPQCFCRLWLWNSAHTPKIILIFPFSLKNFSFQWRIWKNSKFLSFITSTMMMRGNIYQRVWGKWNLYKNLIGISSMRKSYLLWQELLSQRKFLAKWILEASSLRCLKWRIPLNQLDGVSDFLAACIHWLNFKSLHLICLQPKQSQKSIPNTISEKLTRLKQKVFQLGTPIHPLLEIIFFVAQKYWHCFLHFYNFVILSLKILWNTFHYFLSKSNNVKIFENDSNFYIVWSWPKRN